MVNVLDSHVDPLLDVSIADLLVDDDSDCGFGDIVDHTGLAVVDLVRHAVRNISISLPFAGTRLADPF